MAGPLPGWLLLLVLSIMLLSAGAQLPPAQTPIPPTAKPPVVTPPVPAAVPPTVANAPQRNPAVPPVAQAPVAYVYNDSLFPPCQGVDVQYITQFTKKIYPYLNDTPWIQPYKFQAVATMTNMGYSTLKNWALGIQYQHKEVLVSAGTAVLTDGRVMPVDVSNGTVLTGFPPENILNAIETAGDLTLIQKVVPIVGVEFGVKLDPMPLSINITNPGYNCSVPTLKGNNTMHICCIEQDRNISLTNDDVFLPPEKGNITITYDVTQAYQNNYMALVTISNDNVIAAIENWNLSWTWSEGEFINSMQGAQPKVADLDVCLNGAAALAYVGGPDVNKASSCSVSPEILDLPVDYTNDTGIGGIKYCCKNGTILPAIVDPLKSKAAFLMNVYKVPPGNTDFKHLVPPEQFRFGDGYYKCGIPRLIAPTVFPDPFNLLRTTAAVRTWQVTCNVTDEVKRIPKCCVTFSASFNDSIMPCRACACGCPEAPVPVCDKNSSALLLPFGALTLAPENRTNQIIAWAGLRHKAVPNPLPCQDYCGVSINWHIASDFTKGWSARMTLLDWSNVTYPDWFVVVKMDKAYPGFEQGYSFNTTKLPQLNDTFANNSFLVEGIPMVNNYLMAAENFVSGKLQSVLSFTKATTPGINIPLGDGFPDKIWFNGEECVLPEALPTSSSWRRAPAILFPTLLALFVFLLNHSWFLT